MTNTSRPKKTFSILLYALYLLFLTKVILFKYPVTILIDTLQRNDTVSLATRIAYSNFIPGKTILLYLNSNLSQTIIIQNLLGNILLFTPLGIIAPYIYRSYRPLKVVIHGFLLSLFFETVQLLTGFGSFDVDDLILNTLGILLGTLIIEAYKYTKNKKGSSGK